MISSLSPILSSLYGLSLDLHPLAGELDLNFKGRSPDNQSYVIKLMRTGCEESLIDFQCMALLHLADRVQELALPHVILSLTDKPYVWVDIEGEQRLLWVLSFCQGALWADVKPHSFDLLENFGESIAHLTYGFEGFTHPAMKRGILWELTEAMQSREWVQHIQRECQKIAERVFERFENEILPRLATLPYSVIHNDANDYNVLVQRDAQDKAYVSSIFDFGDMAYQPTICELAIALSYAIMGQDKPLQACAAFLKGYRNVRSLRVEEVDVLLDLIKTRLAVSIAISSHRQILEPDDPYITISQTPAKSLLKQLDGESPAVAHCLFRQACGHPITDHAEAVRDYLDHRADIQSVMQVDPQAMVLDLSVGSLLLGANPEAGLLPNLKARIDQAMAEAGESVAFGRYAESRRLYASGNFGDDAYPTEERRTLHLGLDIFCESGSPVYAALDGTVEILTIMELPLDYGGLIVLKHITDQGRTFFTLYGHLAHESLTHLELGQSVQAGEQIAVLGAAHENGGWPPHLHAQIILDLLDLGKDFPGVALQSEADLWQGLSPNPALLIPGLDPERIHGAPNPKQVLHRRQKRLGFNLSLSYQQPLHLVSGFGQFIYDSHAQAYLDVYNNVPHVGHSHPRVVRAVQQHIALLNTNTRYLHEQALDYAERLSATLPDGLDVCYFVNSASEANDLALRIARAYTGRKDMLVVEAAYHGHTSSLIDISPYKHDGPGGQGAPDWVHTIPIADDYRGIYKRGQSDLGMRYAEQVKSTLDRIEGTGRQVAAFIAETYPSVGGQIMPPTDYLKHVYAHVRAHGGLCIADEVQTGFGRLGDSFWGIDSQAVVPDIVIMGKPIANGFPMGALVTTWEIAQAFDNGMEFFSTFGGNPVACAAATAVLDVVQEENLQENAQRLGTQFLSDLREMQSRHKIIGDVRGEGFFLGIELVRDHSSLEPADREASYVVNRLREQHILAGIDGPLHNVIKIRPSMVITERDMAHVTEVLDGIFGEL